MSSSIFIVMYASLHDRRNMLRIHRRHLRDTTDPFHIPEARFMELFRFSKDAAIELLSELRPYLERGQRSTFIPNPLRLCAALHFYATGSFLRDIGQDFVCPMSKTMISRIVHNITMIIQNHLMKKYIVFPTTYEDQRVVKERFLNATGFPGVLGAIDCTHVKIKKPPTESEYCYLNRKRFFSKNVQLVCDFDLRILGCNGRFGESTHDAFIWESSRLKAFLHNKHTENGFSDGWLIGDSGYPLQPWLMTPYRNVDSASQEQFNKTHIQARNCVERLNGVLKKVFACLSGDRGLMVSPVFAGSIINACCTLPNFRRKHNLQIPEGNILNDFPSVNIEDATISNSVLNEGRATRLSITRNYF